MATMLSLQQALKSLCSKTGWCYAVFWKLKRRSRMMLTWEDGYCDYSRSYGDVRNNASHVYTDKGGNPLDQGGSGDLEGQISLAVARMSYYVYSMGEGVIGRVAFTGKYQWAFHDAENHLENLSGCNLSNQYASEKSPDDWQNQFAAGIKTIAVIAVSQGVVQLGSSKLMKEDTKWIDQVKSVFSALQTPSAPRPESVLEGQARSLYTKKPTVFSSNACSLTRKITVSQHNQFALRNVGDPMELQKLGAQESPAVVASMHGGHSIGGPISVSRAIGQELQFQQTEKVLAEPQYVKNLLGVGLPQIKQRNVNDLHFSVPSTGSKCILLPKGFKSPATDDFMLGNSNRESMWSSLVAEGLPSDLHDTSPGCHVLSTCQGSSVDKFSSHMQDDSSLKTKLAMCSMPESKKYETFSSGFLGAHQEQHQGNCSNAKDATLAPADFSCGASEIVSNQYIDDLANIASANIASQLSARIDGPFGIPFVVKKPDTCQIENGWKLCANGGFTDLTSLEEIEKLLSSFCKEEIANQDSSYAIGDELSQALGPAFRKGVLDDLQNEAREQKYEELASLASKEAERLPTLPAEEVEDWQSGLGSENSHENFTALPLEDKSELLLDAVVGIANNQSLNRNARLDVKMPLNRCGMDTLSASQETRPIHNSSLSGKPMMQTSPHREVGSYDNLTGALRNLQSHQKVCVSSETHTTASVQSWTDDVYSLKSDDTQRTHSLSKRSEEFSKSSRKRSRSGENVRPRPKDRQQIQDRVRELRDIVPSGSKCSIDALLEKTIKHMLFLHSVTLHAEQLKNVGDLKEDSDNGASWAFDLGSPEKQIPIVVKDLNQPRQMLVEMICEESGLFLETADAIRNLGLKILRGSMDFYEDRYLARFIVEANREIQRVDVLVSLIQRLHLDNNSSCSSMTMASQSNAVKP